MTCIKNRTFLSRHSDKHTISCTQFIHAYFGGHYSVGLQLFLELLDPRTQHDHRVYLMAGADYTAASLLCAASTAIAVEGATEYILPLGVSVQTHHLITDSKHC